MKEIRKDLKKIKINNVKNLHEKFIEALLIITKHGNITNDF